MVDRRESASVSRILDPVNALLRHVGLLLVPKPSAKMLNEHANVSEAHHPSRGGNTVRWMRRVAEWAAPGGNEYR